MDYDDKERDERSGTRAPTFDGDKAKWPFYKKRMESYLARSGLGDMLREQTSDDLKRDEYVFPDATDQQKADKEEGENLQKMNRKAAGIIMNSITTDTKKGQAVFYLVEKFHDADLGFAGGQFWKEWGALKKRFDTVKAKTLQELEEEYYTAKMTEEDEPSLWITDLERLKIKLKEKKHDIPEEDFLNGILNKLPESKDPGVMHPYQVKKMFIKEDMAKAGSSYDLDDLILDLEEVYKDHFEEKETTKSKNEGERGFYTTGGGYKGKCRNCGKMGHQSKDCWSKKGKENGGGKYPKKSEPGKKFEGECFHCHKKGHRMSECWKLNGKPNNKKGESAHTAKGPKKGRSPKDEVAFMCMGVDTQEPYSFVPVDWTIDEEGYSVPDSFFDAFESEPETSDDEDEAEPEWYIDTVDALGIDNRMIEEDALARKGLGLPKKEEKWTTIKPKRIASRQRNKDLHKASGKGDSCELLKDSRAGSKIGLRPRGNAVIDIDIKFDITLHSSPKTNKGKEEEVPQDVVDSGHRNDGNVLHDGGRNTGGAGRPQGKDLEDCVEEQWGLPSRNTSYHFDTIPKWKPCSSHSGHIEHAPQHQVGEDGNLAIHGMPRNQDDHGGGDSEYYSCDESYSAIVEREYPLLEGTRLRPEAVPLCDTNVLRKERKKYRGNKGNRVHSRTGRRCNGKPRKQPEQRKCRGGIRPCRAVPRRPKEPTIKPTRKKVQRSTVSQVVEQCQDVPTSNCGNRQRHVSRMASNYYFPILPKPRGQASSPQVQRNPSVICWSRSGTQPSSCRPPDLGTQRVARAVQDCRQDPHQDRLHVGRPRGYRPDLQERPVPSKTGHRASLLGGYAPSKERLDQARVATTNSCGSPTKSQ